MADLANPTAAGVEPELLQKLLRQFEDAFDQSQRERALAEQCRDYYDGQQWTEDEIEALRKRKQPVVTSNRIKPKIDSLLGYERRSRTDPKAYPRTPKHDKDAEGATDAIRFVCDQNRFQQLRSEASENLFVEGIGAATVAVKQRKDGEFEITLSHVPWDRFYRDPHSRRRDFSDASFLGVVLWMDEAEALSKFEGRDEQIKGSYSTSDDGADTYDDRPKLKWADPQRKRIRVLQHRWIEDGVWHTAILCRGGFLRDAQPSPYLDEYGEPECDLIAMSAYVTRENDRYGVVKQHLSAQDEINKRRSKALHRLSTVQVIAEKGAVPNVAAAKRELAKPDGYVERNPNMAFEVRDGTTALQGELELLREAKAEIDTSGVNPSLGGNVNAPSGRAQEVAQAAGLSEQAVVFEAIRDWSLRCYRSIWNRVRQYWTEEKWVRVTDDEHNLKWVALNHPVTAAEEVQRLQEAGEPIPPELIQQMQIDPNAVIRTDNEVAGLDVDILVEDGPDTVTIQSEQFEELVKIKTADPQSIPTAMVIEASSLRNKDRILEHLESNGLPPELLQKLQEMEQKLQEAQAQLESKQTETALDMRKLEIDQYKAETDRLKLLAELQRQPPPIDPMQQVM